MSEQEQKVLNGYIHVRHAVPEHQIEQISQLSETFYKEMDSRRSVREYSNEPIPRAVIENIIKTASTAPSGAHKQPWTFCAVANSELKTRIREAAEAEERESYEKRMSERWLKDLEPMATNPDKPFLEIAPWLIIVFKKAYELNEKDEKVNNYYVNESVGIACGMLIAAIHRAGLVTLTHTPSPMDFLGKLLNRPANERAFLLLPVGKPKSPVYVPDLKRKPLDEVAVFYE